MLSREKIEERRRKLLSNIIRAYIETATPVASKNLVYRYRLNLSPATVRNIMAQLEKLGYLTHPHTSAGRIPTDKGYRYYVDTIMQEEQLTPSEKKRILMQLINTQWDEIDRLLEKALEMVTKYTNEMSILLHDRAENIYIEKIDLIYINRYKILFVIVTDSGDVIHLYLENEELPSIEVEKFLKFVNSELRGEAFHNLKNKIKLNLISSSNPFYHIFSLPLSLLVDVLDKMVEKEFFYLGTNKIMRHPEFQEIEDLQEFIDMLENKVELIKILEEHLEHSDLNIQIGKENPYHCIHKCSIITARYKFRGRPLGIIGVLGPTRLHYSRIISVVKYVAEVLGQAIESTIF
jgi:heat-inducible transcriptional repressor